MATKRRSGRAPASAPRVDGSAVSGLTWTARRAPKYYPDFNQYVGRTTENSTGFAVCYVTVDAAMHDLVLKIGSDDGIKAYLNGREILNHAKDRELKVDDDVIPGRIVAVTARD